MPERIELDDGSYEGFYQKAMERLFCQAAWWTHRELSDPGITQLELWALLSDMQSFYMDQIQESHYRKYLKLLGVRPDHGSMAYTWLGLEHVQAPLCLPAGTKFLADKMVFETTEEVLLTDNRLTAFFMPREADDKQLQNMTRQMGMSRKYAFPMSETCMLFCFMLQKAVMAEKTLQLFLLLREKEERNPVEDPGFYMAGISWVYRTKKGWKPATVLLDETKGLLYSGQVILKMDEGMEKEETEAGYPVCCIVTEGAYDVLPVLYKICLNTVKVVQKDTLCVEEYASWSPEAIPIPLKSYLGKTGVIRVFLQQEGEVAGKEVFREITSYCRISPAVTSLREERYVVVQCLPADCILDKRDKRIKFVCSADSLQQDFTESRITGLPAQEAVLPWETIYRDSIRLQLRTGEGSPFFCTYECREPEAEQQWAFHMADEENTLLFGDGRHGRIPEPSRDGLVFTNLELFEGCHGNVAIGKINRWERTELSEEISCKNLLPGRGGRDRRLSSEIFENIQQMWERPYRAVTAQDYAKLAAMTPGLIIKKAEARVLEKGHVKLTVYSHDSMSAEYCIEKYKQEIQKQMEPYRIITGTMEVEIKRGGQT